MHVADFTVSFNQQYRNVVASFLDGGFTRIVTVDYGQLVIRQTDGNGAVLHESGEWLPEEFYPMDMAVNPSGFDGKLIVTLVGFNAGTQDARVIVRKLNYVVQES